jgi:hypothetical protein
VGGVSEGSSMKRVGTQQTRSTNTIDIVPSANGRSAEGLDGHRLSLANGAATDVMHVTRSATRLLSNVD